MAKVAILGFGTVGSGVLEVIRTNASSISRRVGQEVSVKYICDIRDFSGHPDEKLFVKEIDTVLRDEEVQVVVETIGGLNPAYFYVKSALESGKHVATSNKELVAVHGAELLALAKDKGVCFLFEASVGGGMPMIAPLRDSLAANVVQELYGIINGTTNFMLTEMAEKGCNFDEALHHAQELGYAETRDPSADVDGIDAQRKICILSSLILGREIHPENVPVRGIRGIAPEDFKALAACQSTVKLIARFSCRDDVLSPDISVEPMAVPKESPLAGVNDVYNAAMIRCDMLGDVMFYGKGAGKLPTASAVVADVMDVLVKQHAASEGLMWRACEPLEQGTYFCTEQKSDWYMRGRGASAPQGMREIWREGERFAGIVRGISRTQWDDFCEKAEKNGFCVENTMRLLAK